MFAKENLQLLFLIFWKRLKKFLLTLLQTAKKKTQELSLPLWQILALILPTFICIYYLVGGLIINSIDTSASVYKASTEGNKSATIDMSIYLIHREVQNKLWTPSLPFLFPSYFLDNMPNFQLGLMSSVSKIISVLNNTHLQQNSETAAENLNKAAELLKYPGDVWLFSPQNKLLPAPSSATQYRKGRKKLQNFNREFSNGQVSFDLSPKNLVFILTPISQDLKALATRIDDHIRENSKSLIDTKADNTFYFAQGKLYAYEMLLTALGLDFKQVLVKTGTYAQWTSLIKDLESAADLNPSFVHNGKLNSSMAPNHLASMNYLNIKAYMQLKAIIQQLENFSDTPHDN